MPETWITVRRGAGGILSSCGTNENTRPANRLPTLDAHDRTRRFPDDGVGVGSQPSQCRTHGTLADHDQVSIVIPRGIADRRRNFTAFDTNLGCGTGFLLQLGDVFPRGFDE